MGIKDRWGFGIVLVLSDKLAVILKSSHVLGKHSTATKQVSSGIMRELAQKTEGKMTEKDTQLEL